MERTLRCQRTWWTHGRSRVSSSPGHKALKLDSARRAWFTLPPKQSVSHLPWGPEVWGTDLQGWPIVCGISPLCPLPCGTRSHRRGCTPASQHLIELFFLLRSTLLRYNLHVRTRTHSRCPVQGALTEVHSHVTTITIKTEHFHHPNNFYFKFRNITTIQKNIV